MTRPQITGSLDLNMSYSITPTAVNEDYMTAWFRFERVLERKPFRLRWVQEHLLKMVEQTGFTMVSLVERLSFLRRVDYNGCLFI